MQDHQGQCIEYSSFQINSYMDRNNPNDNRKYNYVYKLTNEVNNKIYIGAHRTDNIDDGYMGSGVLLKRAIKLHGKEKFIKEILKFFPTYQEALDYERSIVTQKFIEENTNYNIKEGGFGSCKWSSKVLEHLSKCAVNRNKDPEFKEKMRLLCYDNEERNNKISEGVCGWIENNPEQHKARMDRINKNPEKIQKTALKHTGMKRSKEACDNIKQGCLKYIEVNKEKKSLNSGKGCLYIHNPGTTQIKRWMNKDTIPKGWVIGKGEVKDKSGYKNMNKGSYFVYNPNTLMLKRIQSADTIPEGWIKGRPIKEKTKNG